MAFIMSKPTPLSPDDITAMQPSKADREALDRAVVKYAAAERKASSARRQMRQAEDDYDAILLRIKAASFDRLRHQDFLARATPADSSAAEEPSRG